MDQAVWTSSDTSHRSTWPGTLWLGLGLIVVAECLLFADVYLRSGVVLGDRQALPEPGSPVEVGLRWFAMHFTPVAWIGFLLSVEGLLTMLSRGRGVFGGSCVRRRPWLFVVATLSSVSVWCFWDWVNFYFMRAWSYHGLPSFLPERYAGYFIAFAAISPAMFLSAQLYMQLGMRRMQTPGQRAWVPMAVLVGAMGVASFFVLTLTAYWTQLPAHDFGILPAAMLVTVPGLAAVVISRNLYVGSFVFGLGMLVYSILVRDPLANFTLWAAPMFLLDPLNRLAGRPSILDDWRHGRWGRMLSLMAGGLTCGFFWEFWNYWAAAKWVYHLPFLGVLEQIRYFEMPVVGLTGFLPFGPSCWVILQSLLILMPQVTEPLPSADDVM